MHLFRPDDFLLGAVTGQRGRTNALDVPNGAALEIRRDGRRNRRCSCDRRLDCRPAVDAGRAANRHIGAKSHGHQGNLGGRRPAGINSNTRAGIAGVEETLGRRICLVSQHAVLAKLAVQRLPVES